MSALPHGALHPMKSNKFQALAIEQPDNTILTDQEVYELKGGDKFFLAKFGAGLLAAIGFLQVSGRFSEFRAIRVSGSTFFWANVVCFGTMILAQRLYLESNGLYPRYKAHKLALYHRYILNMSQINADKKKPKFH
jgi:hypothetical protein